MISNLLCSIKDSTIKDIIAVGAVDIEDGIAEFLRDLRFLYIEFEKTYIKLESVMQYSLLKIELQKDIDFNYDVDEDMYKAKESLSEIVLDNSLWVGNEVTVVALYDYDKTTETCASMELQLANGQKLFFDPSYYYGIKVGGIEQYNRWAENYHNRDKMVKKVYEAKSGWVM